MPLSFMDATKVVYNPKTVSFSRGPVEERAKAQLDAVPDVASPIAEVTSDITHALESLSDQIVMLDRRVSCISMAQPPLECDNKVSEPTRGGSSVFVCLNETLNRVRLLQNKVTIIINGLEI